MTVTTVTVYRSAGWLWRASAAHVEVDGQPVGVLRGKARLTLELAPGRHTFGANIGRIRSAETQIDVAAEAPVIVALRPNLERAAGRSGGEQLLLIETDSFADRGPALRQAYRDRPPVGYRRRSRTDQILWLAAFALILIGQVVTHTGHKPLGVMISAPGMVVIVVVTSGCSSTALTGEGDRCIVGAGRVCSVLGVTRGGQGRDTGHGLSHVRPGRRAGRR